MRDRVGSAGAILAACALLGCGYPALGGRGDDAGLSLESFALHKITTPAQDPVFELDTLATRPAGAGTWIGITDAGTWMASGGAYRNPAAPLHSSRLQRVGSSRWIGETR